MGLPYWTDRRLSTTLARFIRQHFVRFEVLFGMEGTMGNQTHGDDTYGDDT